jgi:hypothetical protein
MEKEFITYNQALALKELGFDEPCLKMAMSEIDIINTERTDEGDYPKNSHLFSGWVAIPTYSAAFRWFRKKYGLIGQPIPLCISYPGKVTHYGWSIVSNQNSIDWENEDNGFKIYEEAELACLDKLIEICKTK